MKMDRRVMTQGGGAKTWAKYNAVSENTYQWDKYNITSTTVYTWKRYNITTTVNFIGSNGLILQNGEVYSSYSVSGTTISTSGTSYYVTCDAGGNNYSKYSGYYVNYNGSVYKILYTNGVNTFCSEGSVSKSKGSYIGTISSTSSSSYPNGGYSDLYYFDSRTSSTTYSCGTTSYGTVTSTNINAYLSDSYSGSYWYKNRTIISTTYTQGTTSYGTVTSTDANAYPENGYYNGYWYVLQ